MKLIKYTLLFASIAILTSCEKDYLNTSPTDSKDEEIVYDNTQNLSYAVNGLAKLMTAQHLESQGFNGEGTIKMYYGNYPGANFYVNLPGWAPIINSTFNENVSSIYNYYPWYYYYKIIGNANAIIFHVDAAKGTEKEKQYLKAQALSYRAYSYMMLAQIYANRWSDSGNGSSNGLVLRTDLSTGNLATSTLAETYDLIYKDLTEALDLFDKSQYVRDPKKNFMINADVTAAIFARAALNKQDYVNAEKYAILARKNAPLMSASEYKAGFANPTSEWIWSSYGGSEENLFFYSYFSMIAYNSSASAVRTLPKIISKELFNKIPATDIRKGMFLDPENLAYTTTTGRAGEELTKKAFRLYPEINDQSLAFAYMNFKFKAFDQPGVGHLNHFRSSEMVLIEAEAKYFQNKSATEIQSLLTTLNASTGRNPEYVCTATGNDLLNEIKVYRNIELWGEGFDWFDMKRWGDTIDRKGYDQGGNFLDALAVKITPEMRNKWTWKLPLKETDYNKLIELK